MATDLYLLAAYEAALAYAKQRPAGAGTAIAPSRGES
jgi:hypothetical protein